MKTVLFAALIVLTLSLSSAGDLSIAHREALYTFNYENVLGTSLELKIGARSLEQAEIAESAARAEIAREAKILSAWDDSSEFSRWFETSGQPVHVSREFFEVLGLFDQWRTRTNGVLDAAAEVITRVWKAGEKEGRVPSRDDLAAAVSSVRRPHWKLDATNQTATHISDTPLALNSFAKSYIVGHAADVALASDGIRSVVVNIGGDLVVRGALTEPVDIADPKSDAENSVPLATLLIHDRAVATSGNYRRGVEIGGLHYSHIVDPRTGMPVEEIVSSTVVAPNAADAGALATALSVLTTVEGRRLAASVPGAEFLLVTKDGERVMSPGWLALVSAAQPPVRFFLAAATDTPAWDRGFELTIGVELPPFGFQAHRPYLAVWVEDKDKFPVRTIALWEKKPKYLSDLRFWYRDEQTRERKEGSDITHSVSSATRSPGKYTINWDGKDNTGKYVKPGRYTVFIEAAREHGSYGLMQQEMDFSSVPKKVNLPGNSEVTAAFLDYHKLSQ
jgi:thiamine biosynthesis lipoprotein ApbE